MTAALSRGVATSVGVSAVGLLFVWLVGVAITSVGVTATLSRGVLLQWVWLLHCVGSSVGRGGHYFSGCGCCCGW